MAKKTNLKEERAQLESLINDASCLSNYENKELDLAKQELIEMYRKFLQPFIDAEYPYLEEKQTGNGCWKKYRMPQHMAKKALEYFEYYIKINRPLTVTGLALYLGFAGRHPFYEYKKYEEYADLTKTLIALIEEDLLTIGINNPQKGRFASFVLTNMGYLSSNEKQVVETHSIDVSLDDEE